jgi:iron(III) transport system ATP-binding protein/putative spermidine/putrescine transport system ATP-binding protein
MRIELKRLQRGLGITTLFVTHDQSEALSMSDRICVMAKGIVQQFATPEDVYGRPATGFVANFIGTPNRLSGTVASRRAAGGSVRLGSGLVVKAGHVDGPEGAAVDVVIRQEAIRLNGGAAEADALAGAVALRSFNGARVQYVVKLAEDVELVAEAPSSGPHAALAVGSPVSLVIDPNSVFAMKPDEAAA